MKRVGFKVTGVSFVPEYPRNLHALQNIAERQFIFGGGTFGGEMGDPEPLPCVLIRDPDNEHDKFAIEIHVPSLGENGRIGYVPAAIAQKLSPLIDEGTVYSAEITSVLIHESHPDRPGIDVSCRRQD